MKIDCRKAARIERKMIIRNDRLRYEIERFKRMDVIERYAAENGMRQIRPCDFETIILNDK